MTPPYGPTWLLVVVLIGAGLVVGLVCHLRKPDTHSDYYRRKGRGE